MPSWVKLPPAGWPGQMVWTWLLVTPTPLASSRYADAPVPSCGCTTSSAELYRVVVGTYALSPPLERSVVIKLLLYSCCMIDGTQFGEAVPGQ